MFGFLSKIFKKEEENTEIYIGTSQITERTSNRVFSVATYAIKNKKDEVIRVYGRNNMMIIDFDVNAYTIDGKLISVKVKFL
jgi:isocitrate/isopropylmalate dehydrogenase